MWTEFERIGHVPLPPYIKRAGPARRSRALPDRLRARSRLGRGADRGSTLHRVAYRRMPRGGRDSHTSRCTSGSARSSRCTPKRWKTRTCTAEQLPASPPEQAAKIRAAQRVVAVGTTSVRTVESAWQSGDAGRRDRNLHLSRLPVPARRGDADELPSAAHQPAAAGLRVRRNRISPRGLSSRGGSSATASTRTATAC